MENYGYTQSDKDQNQQTHVSYRSEKKIPAALLGILVGWLGLNKFYLGYTKEGISDYSQCSNIWCCNHYPFY